MFKLDFSVRRVYVASFAAIAYVFAHRSVAGHDWHITRTLSAIASDAAILALLFFAYAALDRWLQPKSLAAKSHRAFHFRDYPHRNCTRNRCSSALSKNGGDSRHWHREVFSDEPRRPHRSEPKRNRARRLAHGRRVLRLLFFVVDQDAHTTPEITPIRSVFLSAIAPRFQFCYDKKIPMTPFCKLQKIPSTKESTQT